MSAAGHKPLKVLSPLHKASRQIADALALRLCDLPVGCAEAHVIAYLAAYAPCTVGQLSTVFGHKPSTMTSILDRIEQAGLLERETNPDDRRSWVVRPTKQGRAIARSIRKHTEVLENEILNQTAPEDLRGFRNVMKAIETATDHTGSGNTRD